MSKTGPYTKKVIEYFKKPHNYGRMKNPDGVGKVGNVVCGDVMWLYIKVGKDKQGKEIIKQASFSTLGCAVAIANTSLLTTMIKRKTLKEAMKITKEDLIKKLGGVPLFKIHCSLLAVDALTEAIYNYLSKTKKSIPEKLREKHQRIEKQRKEIERRYKEGIKIDENLHKERK